MRAKSFSRWLAAAAAGLFSVSLVAALVNAPPDPKAPPPQSPLAQVAGAVKARDVVPLFAKTEPAANPTELVVMPDESGLRGWVAGSKSYAGSKVTIKAGNKTFDATVGDDNTFAWAHSVVKPQAVTVTVAPPVGERQLTATATLPAKPHDL